MTGGSDFEFRKLPGFREAVKPRPVAGDRSHEATFFYYVTACITARGDRFIVKKQRMNP